MPEKIEQKQLSPEFSFIIEGMSKEVADQLYNIVGAFAESHKLLVIGGFVMVDINKDESDEDNG